MPSLAKASDLLDEARDDDNEDTVMASLDPLDPRKVALDIFELYCHEMATTSSVGRRAYLIDKMRYMIKRLIGHQYDFGRLYNRTCTANIIARVCGRYAYSSEDSEQFVIGNQTYFIPECLVEFTPQKWEKIIAQFDNLRGNLLRNDASLTVPPAELDDNNEALEDDQLPIPKDDDSIDMELESHDDFSKGYENVLDLLKFHTCMSHLRPQLDTAIQSSGMGGGGGAESVVIPRENIVAFESAIGQYFENIEDCKCARILSDLLAKKRINKSRQLKSLSEIRKIYSAHEQVFDLKRFQQKFLQLIRSWVHLVLPVPTLSQFNYGAVDTSGSGGARKSNTVVDNKKNMNGFSENNNNKKSNTDETSASARSSNRKKGEGKSPAHSAVEEDPIFDTVDDDEDESKPKARGDLKRKRDALTKNVKDPFKECLAEAKTARLVRGNDSDEGSDVPTNHVPSSGRKRVVTTPSMRKEKASAHTLRFSDSEESDEDEGVKLSALPERFKSTNNPQEIQIGNFSPKKKRAKFTEVEDRAIREGVKRFGSGSWTEIKVNYAMELKNRGTVQIKDRWRTLNKDKDGE